MLDYYGGPHYVTVEEYMAADPETQSAQTLVESDVDEFNPQIIRHSDDERIITVKFKKDSPVRRINLEV